MTKNDTALTGRPNAPEWRTMALKVAVFYALAAGLWIYCSDQLLGWLATSPAQLAAGQTLKGWLFVLVTGGLLYGYLAHCLRRQQDVFDQLATLFDAFPAIVYVADHDSYELLYVNRFASERFGADWGGKSCFSYLQQNQNQPCNFCSNPLLVKDGQPGQAVIWEFRNTIDGRWYECLDKALRWPDGRLVRVEIAIDITARKEMEQTKDELLSAVSHEMRTPLTAIAGFSELLIDEPSLTEPVRRHVATIHRETEKLQELIETFLEVRRLKTDRARVDYELIDIATLLDTNCARECTARHRFEIDIPAGLAVFGNRRELSQLMRQLVTNACRFSPEGGLVSLRAEIVANEVWITVSDEGIGIPPEERERIFEPFHRLDVGDRRRVRGVGLGLTLSREIAALHGGSILVESVPGHGSSFILKLPHHTQGLSPAATTTAETPR